MQIPSVVRVIHFILAGLVFIVPLYVTQEFVFSFVTEKTFLFYFLIEIALALWLYAVLVQRAYLPPGHPLLLAGGAFLVVYTVAGVVGSSLEMSFFSSAARMSGLVLLFHVAAFAVLLVATVRDRTTWNAILSSAVASGVCIAAASYARVYLGVEVISTQGGFTLGNTSYAGTYLLFIFFLALLLLVRLQTYRAQLCAGAAAIFIGFCPLLFSFFGLADVLHDPAGILGGARAASAALWIGLVVAAVLYATRLEYIYARRIAQFVLGAMVFGVLFVSVSTVVPGSRVQQFLTNEGLGSRLLFWNSAYSGIAERPLFGWGPENYFVPFYKYFEPELLSARYTSGAEAHSDKPHNAYLELLVGGGIVAGLSYLILIGVLYWRLFIITLRAGEDSIAASLLIGLTTGYLFQNIFFFDTLTSYLFFSFVIAYTVWLDNHTVQTYHRITQNISFPAVAAAGLAFFVVASVCVYRPYVQQRMLVDMFTSMNTPERVTHYEELFALSAQGRTHTIVYLLNRMNDAVRENLPHATDAEQAVIMQDVQGLRLATLPYIGDNPVHYRLIFSFEQLLLSEAAATEDEVVRAARLAEAERYEMHLTRLSPNNPLNDWIKAQRQLLSGETEHAVATLENAAAQYPAVEGTNDLLLSARAYAREDGTVPLFAF